MNLEMFFSKNESELLKKIETSNKEEMLYWRLPNIIYPFAVVLISIICFALFKQGEKFTFIGLINLLFNGSLPMIALNRMSSMGSNLFKFDKSKEGQFNKNTRPLRVKVDDYSKILLLLICILYIYQVMEGPFNLNWFLLLQMLSSLVLIYCAIILSKFAYLLQENFLERTIADEVRSETKKNRAHLSKKYGL